MLYLVLTALYLVAAMVFIGALCWAAKRPLPRVTPESLRMQPVQALEPDFDKAKPGPEPLEHASPGTLSAPDLEATPDPAQS